jgi:methyl coenzyme M reductase subunit C-like uncharacterized protein (methanogenesis marker protein 7)
LIAEFRRFSVDAPEPRDAMLVAMADAAVIVWDECDPALRRVLQLVERKSIPVHVIGAPEKQKVRKVRGPEETMPTRRGYRTENRREAVLGC